MILLDTHIWVWWMSDKGRLRKSHRALLESSGETFGVSVISCWEVAKLVENGRLVLDQPVEVWISRALTKPGLQLLPITLEISIESTQLPQPFHRDPADQMIVATARHNRLRLLTEDDRILAYAHVQTVP